MRFADFTAFDLFLLVQGLGVNIALFARDSADRTDGRDLPGQSSVSIAYRSSARSHFRLRNS